MKKKINLHMFAMIYFLLFFIAVAFNEHDPFIKFPKLDDQFWSTMGIDSLIAIAIGLFVVATSWILNKYYGAFRNLTRAFNDILGPLTRIEIFFVAIFSSISEEFFFRGLLQEKMGIVFASFIFGMLHSGPGKKYLPWTIFATVMGFVLGATYVWRGNLIVPVVIHFVVNFLNLTMMQKMTVEPEKFQDTP